MKYNNNYNKTTTKPHSKCNKGRTKNIGGTFMWVVSNIKGIAITVTIVVGVSAIGIAIIKDKINDSIKDAKLKNAIKQRDANIIIDNGDGTKSTDIGQAIQFKLDDLEMDMKKDFSEAGVTTLYSDRLYEGDKENKPSYEESPDLYINVQYEYKTKLNGTINLTTNVLPSFKYSMDRRKIEVTQVANSLYVNIPDETFISEGYIDNQEGTTTKDSFGAAVSQAFNKKLQEEGKAHEGLNKTIQSKLKDAAKKRLVDDKVISEVRKAAVATLKEDLKPYMNISHVIIKANGSSIKDELKK